MKKITIAIFIVIAIIIGIAIGILNKNSDESTKLNMSEQITKVYNDLNDMNINLTSMSQYYLLVWNNTINNGQISKKEISEIINIDYNKFLSDTDEMNKNVFTTVGESIGCLNIFYNNSGIDENIKNKLVNIRVEIDNLSQEETEKNINVSLSNIYNRIVNYYQTIINPNGNLEDYKSNVFNQEEIIEADLNSVRK